ncbi:MAG: alpha/beta fold hydrolase [Actinomycetota bacterium]
MSVVVLHGFTGDASTMRDLAERIDPAAIVPELAGHGAGPHPADPASYTVDAMVDAVLSLTDEPIDLVGYSMGGRVAFTAACRHPDRVRSLTLIGASAGLADAEERQARALADDELAELIERDLTAFVDRWMANPLFATQARLGGDYLARSRSQRLGNDPTALATSLRQASTGRMSPLHDLLDRCTMPVALVAGGDDAKFVAIAETLARRLPDARVHVADGVGHAAHLEAPDAVAAIARTNRERV